MTEDNRCPRCGREGGKNHEQVCRQVHDSPFSSAGVLEREGTETCPMCQNEYESYLDHIQECPAGNQSQ